jgi:hypothetical protein
MRYDSLNKKTIRRNLHYVKAVLIGGHWSLSYDFYVHELNISKFYFCNKVELIREILFLGTVLAVGIVTILNFI